MKSEVVFIVLRIFSPDDQRHARIHRVFNDRENAVKSVLKMGYEPTKHGDIFKLKEKVAGNESEEIAIVRKEIAETAPGFY